MKKLLGALAALSMTATTAAAVVACESNEIRIINLTEGKEGELIKAIKDRFDGKGKDLLTEDGKLAHDLKTEGAEDYPQFLQGLYIPGSTQVDIQKIVGKYTDFLEDYTLPENRMLTIVLMGKKGSDNILIKIVESNSLGDENKLVFRSPKVLGQLNLKIS